MTENEAAAFAVGGFLGTLLIGLLVFYILVVIAFWKIFKKMGEPGWKAIIPFYNVYIIYKRCWKTSMFWVTIIIALGAGILISAGGVTLTETGYDTSHITALGYVGAVVEFIAAVMGIMCEYFMYKSFGHGVGWLILSIFFPNIIALVLGFGSSQYIGNGSEMQ